ncbi:hypothetical protein K4B79_17490 [Streptomyces lincolnensis]|uniref:hypothetical protein n=1 Tax=Streptomyces lincolnensis TaxID=1915 RepID=UPI001E3C5606|nr:hypothetical protein [Streptomyces lincolnensis]MCD7440012.1 hypothetical protein [Streptomyces lincolnensis]
MGKPNTRRLDAEIRNAERKLKAVRNQEMWPLTGAERRQLLSNMARGSYRITRGKDTDRQDARLEAAWSSAETRLSTEITALQKARQQIVTEDAKEKAAKKSSGWW